MTAREDTQKPFAASPFNDSKADLILRSSDGVYFCVYKLLLSLVSPVFATMFELPTDGMQEMYDNRICIGVDDNNETLSRVLPWCDPRCISAIQSPKDVEIILRVSDKYDMEPIKKRCVRALECSPGIFTPENSFEIYALAIQYQISHLACLAAKMTLHLELEKRPYFPALKSIPASALYHLDFYHITCGKVAQKVIEDEFSVPNNLFGQGSGTVGCCGVEGVARGNLGWKFWAVQHMDRISEKLRKTPVSTVVVDPKLLVETQGRTSSCSACRGNTSHADLQRFNQSLMDKVEQAISKRKGSYVVRARIVLIHHGFPALRSHRTNADLASTKCNANMYHSLKLAPSDFLTTKRGKLD
ncbi:uncharacterized protein LACBIDRAFT_327616 [Laccaria bicolor S238N-H82]|uniref:Predicted protein n=1 Tax=Laccaria bicolor (strain S238N-H82 / ATCC MYA-4686) TaxID=486041 RepID=B0DC99_LACBS|nr:uncharacterized protein LACBIDRAFT_327616 [Laccaria bicolor S238N-H82]EDR07694.1 predicted protein [Laccaria bicolor S238N-H82]|eukprot:XP_001881483.1 predicted protein [Laccaria bicolor S238N-H82]